MRCFAVWHVLRFIHLTLSSTVPFVHVSPVILDVQPQLGLFRRIWGGLDLVMWLRFVFKLETRTIILLIIKFLTPVGEGGGVGTRSSPYLGPVRYKIRLVMWSSRTSILPGVRGTLGKDAEVVKQLRHMRKNKSREITASTGNAPWTKS